jgi:hypothetical protein
MLTRACSANEETELDVFREALKENEVDAVFLGGTLKEGVEGAGLDKLRKQVLERRECVLFFIFLKSKSLEKERCAKIGVLDLGYSA